MRRQVYIRNADAGEFFENFLIAAIASILTVRGVLDLTGYPSIGGDRLHVAHMLWGGLLMVVAIVLLLGFLGKGVKSVAAVVGGVGFGLFIDELGKFITRDNDYFFRPAIALIYVVFILLYFFVRALQRGSLSTTEALANALEITLESVRHDLDVEEKKRARQYLGQADPADPLVSTLAGALDMAPALERSRMTLPGRVRVRARAIYAELVGKPWFPAAVVAFFVSHSMIGLIQAVLLVPRLAGVLALSAAALALAVGAIRAFQRHHRITARAVGIALAIVLIALATTVARRLALPALDPAAWADVAFSILPALFVLRGIWLLPRSRRRAYLMFRRGVLVLIFITQFFAFWVDQLIAVIGLFANIIVLVTLRYMIQRESGAAAIT